MSIIKLILVGGGGHCKSAIEVIESLTGFTIHGILDVKEKINQKILGYNIIGTDEDIRDLSLKGFHFCITAGQVMTSSLRKRLYEKVLEASGTPETIIAGSSLVSKHATLGPGTMVMHHALVNACAVVGNNCIINSNALIEHSVQIGNHTHVSTMAAVNGDCKIGNEVFIGSNSVINHGVSVCDNVIVGAGTVVVENIISPGVYVGNPFKKIS